MAKKGGSKHMKRLPAPANWPIRRKESKWVAKPRPGSHPLRRSLPLLLVIRDILGLAKDKREAKMILSEGHVKVDGKVRREYGYSVGIMDLIEIPSMKKAFRVLPSNKGLHLHAIEDYEKEFKLCKVIAKTTIKKGSSQINLHDGKNILVKTTDHNNPTENTYGIHDMLKIRILNNEILAHLKLEEGVLGIVDGGKNAGVLAEVKKIRRGNLFPTSVMLRDLKGNDFETTINYVFPVGKG
jgi:small subunit ribosomal protein S4e